MTPSDPVAAYERRFGNLADVWPPAIWGDPRFAQLAARALLRDKALTLGEVQAVIPEATFEGCCDTEPGKLS